MISCVRSLVCVMWQINLPGCHRLRPGTRTPASARRPAAPSCAAQSSCGHRGAAACRSSAGRRAAAARAGARRGGSRAHRRRGRRRTVEARRGCGRRGRCPTVSTTAGASKRMPVTVTTPRTRVALDDRDPPTSCWNSVRFGWFSMQAADGRAGTAPVGLGARGAHRRALAGVEGAELDAGARPRRAPWRRPARRSRAPGGPCRCRRWPGCSSSAPRVSMLCVSSSVRAPMRAAASAASVPACPPPTTMTS